MAAQSQSFIQIGKTKHFNGKSIRPTELLELQNNFRLIPTMQTTQKNNIQGVSRHLLKL